VYRLTSSVLSLKAGSKQVYHDGGAAHNTEIKIINFGVDLGAILSQTEISLILLSIVTHYAIV